MTLNVVSPLPDWVETVITRIIGCAVEVHRRLGPGLSEGLYEDAMKVELTFQGLRFECQREVVVHYREQPLRSRVDLVVEDQVIVEIKAVEQLHAIHRAQLISYLRSSGLRGGLLINFNGLVIKGNFERIVL